MPVIGTGVEICTSTTRPTNPVVGTIIYETDTASYRWCTSLGPVVWTGMIPVGTVQSFAGTTEPPGWLFCFGQSLNATSNPQYADLWSMLGTTYGGTGVTAFNLPDLRGRVAFGKDDMGGSAANRITNTGTDNSGILGTNLGSAGGDQRTQQHTHIQNQHTHTTSGDGTHNHDVAAHDYSWDGVSGRQYVAAGRSNAGFGPTLYGLGYVTGGHNHTLSNTTPTNQNTGTGTSQNMPPTIILNYIIKF